MTLSICKSNSRQWAEQKLRLAEDAWLLQSSEHMAHFYARDIAALAACNDHVAAKHPIQSTEAKPS